MWRGRRCCWPVYSLNGKFWPTRYWPGEEWGGYEGVLATVIWVNIEQKWHDGNKYHWFNKNDNNNRGGQLSKWQIPLYLGKFFACSQAIAKLKAKTISILLWPVISCTGETSYLFYNNCFRWIIFEIRFIWKIEAPYLNISWYVFVFLWKKISIRRK